MPGSANNLTTRHILFHTGLVEAGDFATAGATYLGLNAGSDMPEPTQEVSDIAVGQVPTEARLAHVYRTVGTIPTAAKTALDDAIAGGTLLYFYAVNHSKTGYDAFGPGLVSEAKQVSRSSEAAYAAGKVMFAAVGDATDEIAREYAATVALPV